jgi:hypothetical protein
MATIERRLNQDGDEVFRVKVRLQGRPSHTATFQRKTDAKQWAAQVESDLLRGRYFRSAEDQKHTVSDMIVRYLQEVLPHKAKKTQRPRAATSLVEGNTRSTQTF